MHFNNGRIPIDFATQILNIMKLKYKARVKKVIVINLPIIAVSLMWLISFVPFLPIFNDYLFSKIRFSLGTHFLIAFWLAGITFVFGMWQICIWTVVIYKVCKKYIANYKLAKKINV